MELEVVWVVLMEPGRHRMQEALKMMRQGMKLEILPGMRIQGVRMMSLVARIPDPEPGWFGGFCGCEPAGEVAGGRTGSLPCGL